MYISNVKIFLTFDYELFFGKKSGTVDKCMIQPTNDLLNLSKGRDVFYTFFVDVGYLIQAEKYNELTEELNSVKNQLKEVIQSGHDIQLHVHPHWEKTIFIDGEWEMDTQGNYKISDFNENERQEIIHTYKTYLEKLIDRKVTSFRAGGWCIQPFDLLKDIFLKEEIKVDSSVFAGGWLVTDDYAVDFRQSPLKSKYNFEDNVCDEDENGSFTELPISSLRYSPLFFWALYLLGRLSPSQHKMIGDGIFLSQGGRKKRVLTTFTDYHVSSDGYYSKKLEAGLDKAINLNHEELVVIGHPKGNTLYSLNRLNAFIEHNHKKHQFTTFDKEF